MAECNACGLSRTLKYFIDLNRTLRHEVKFHLGHNSSLAEWCGTEMKTGMDSLDGPVTTFHLELRKMAKQTGSGQSKHRKWPVSGKVGSVEELETIPAGTKPETSNYRSP